MRTLILAALSLSASAGLASAQGLTIAHDPVACVVAERFPELRARFDPAGDVGQARVLFRPRGGAHWYAVRMAPGADGYRALLPRPKKALAGFDYYLEVSGRDQATVRTEEFSPVVAANAAACLDRRTAASAVSGAVLLETSAGAAPVPAGFSATGVIAASAGAAAVTAGAVAGASAGAAASGGGATTLLVVGGIAAVAGAGVAVAAATSGGGDETVITGHVYLGECTCAANRPPPYPWLTVGPLAGATISTPLDGTTATTDANGRFELRTPTPPGAPSSFTASATAPGCTSSTWTASSGDNRGDIHLTLTCANGPPPRTSCNCAAGS